MLKSQEGSCIDLIITSRHSLHQFSHVFETGISDHHLMVYTMLKSTYTKLEPKILRKRSYKDFNKESFLRDLQHGLNNIGNFAEFNDEFKAILDHHAPIKQSKLRGNTKPHINKTLRKEIMKRSRLKNKATKSGKEELPKGNNVKDFWNYCKPYFTNKGICKGGRTTLVENDTILKKDSDISETFNNYFVIIKKDLGIFDWADDSSENFTRMSSFSNHPSIQMIKDEYQISLILILNLFVLIKS